MIVADSCVGLCTLSVAWLFVSDHLSIWTLYGITALSSCFEAFQSTAYLSATTLLVPKDQLIRASGLTRLGGAVAKIIAPFVAGILLEAIDLEGIILIDFATLVVALVPLVLLRFPEIGDDGEPTQPQPFFEAVVYGWQYLITRPGLLGLMIFLAASNVVIGAFSVLSTPLILTLTSPTGLGTVLSISSCGLVVGSLLMGIWKSQANQIKTLFGCMVAAGLFIVVSGLRPSVYLFTIADFFLCMMFPIITGLVQVIFQKKVAPDVQGRVFSLQEPLATAGITLGYAIAGPLDELVFEPLMTSDGLFANTFVQMIGLGPGRGIALLDIVMGGLLVIATLCVYQYPRLRQLEDELLMKQRSPQSCLPERRDLHLTGLSPRQNLNHWSQSLMSCVHLSFVDQSLRIPKQCIDKIIEFCIEPYIAHLSLLIKHLADLTNGEWIGDR
jgi:MFS family permease